MSFLFFVLVVFLLAFLKGALGGGFGALGLPLLSLVVVPIHAGVLLALLFIAMDAVALRYWTPSTWSKQNIAVLVPFMLLGIALGFAVMSMLDGRAVALLIGAISILHAATALRSTNVPVPRSRSWWLGALAGASAGLNELSQRLACSFVCAPTSRQRNRQNDAAGASLMQMCRFAGEFGEHQSVVERN